MSDYTKYWVIVFSLILFPAHATPKDDLIKTKQDMQAAKEHAAKLGEDSKALEADLLLLQKNLVDLAASLQKSEAELAATEEKLRIMDQQAKEKQAALEKRKIHLSALVDAALHLSRTPQEAIVLMPAGSKETMTAARALKMATSGIKEEAESIRLQIKELAILQRKVSKHHEELIDQQASLTKERAALTIKLAQRAALQEKLGREREEEVRKIAKLARKAEDLKALFTTITKAPEDTSVESKEGIAGKKGKVRSFARAKNNIRVPLAGRVVRFFGDALGKNETSRGITLVASAGAGVVAPYDGEVVFTGPFLNYGKMVIIRHSDDFHTLLAGLARIDTRPGEFLLEGEPIGAMPDRDSEAKLYIELRKDNQPIDPAPWMNIRK